MTLAGWPGLPNPHSALGNTGAFAQRAFAQRSGGWGGKEKKTGHTSPAPKKIEPRTREQKIWKEKDGGNCFQPGTKKN
jgi:hypothetical protein